MDKTEELLAIGMVFFAFLFVFLVFATYSHEEVHAKIDKYDGLDPRIDIQFLGIGGAKTTSIGSLDKDISNFELAHDFNEVIGYQVAPFLAIISSLLAAIFAFLVMEKWRQKPV